MRTIIAGSRLIHSPGVVAEAVTRSGIRPSVVLSGCASGADRAGEVWAAAHGVPVERFPAQWSRLGRAAGIRRNLCMVAEAEALIAVWDGQSHGTRHVIEAARAAGLRVYVHHVCPTGQFQLAL